MYTLCVFVLRFNWDRVIVIKKYDSLATAIMASIHTLGCISTLEQLGLLNFFFHSIPCFVFLSINIINDTRIHTDEYLTIIYRYIYSLWIFKKIIRTCPSINMSYHVFPYFYSKFPTPLCSILDIWHRCFPTFIKQKCFNNVFIVKLFIGTSIWSLVSLKYFSTNFNF